MFRFICDQKENKFPLKFMVGYFIYGQCAEVFDSFKIEDVELSHTD